MYQARVAYNQGSSARRVPVAVPRYATYDGMRSEFILNSKTYRRKQRTNTFLHECIAIVRQSHSAASENIALGFAQTEAAAPDGMIQVDRSRDHTNK